MGNWLGQPFESFHQILVNPTAKGSVATSYLLTHLSSAVSVPKGFNSFEFLTNILLLVFVVELLPQVSLLNLLLHLLRFADHD